MNIKQFLFPVVRLFSKDEMVAEITAAALARDIENVHAINEADCSEEDRQAALDFAYGQIAEKMQYVGIVSPSDENKAAVTDLLRTLIAAGTKGVR